MRCTRTQMVVVCLATLLLGVTGCFEDQAPSQPLPNAPKKSGPSQVSSVPVKPVDPVSANWNETGQQGLGGKTCSTWWGLSGQSPAVFFLKAAAYVKTAWPAGSFTQVDAVTARYVMPIEKNLFGDVRNAEVTLSTTTSAAGTPCVKFQAAIRAEDLSEASKTVQQEAARLSLATTGNGGQSGQQAPTSPTQSDGQPKVSEFKLLFPLGKPNSISERYEPHTAPISSVFDHKMKQRYYAGVSEGDDTWGVTAFTGEKATIKATNVKGFPVEINSGQELYVFMAPSAVFLKGYALEQPKNELAYDGHPGYDFPIQEGTPVYAAAPGLVVWAGEKQLGKSGFFVRILHEIGGRRFITQYLHLSSPETKLIGLPVARGQLIGLSGRTGTGTGAHLHFEVKIESKGNAFNNNDPENGPYAGGVPIDPYGWLPKDGHDPYGTVNKSVSWGEKNGDSVWMWETPPPVSGD